MDEEVFDQEFTDEEISNQEFTERANATLQRQVTNLGYQIQMQSAVARKSGYQFWVSVTAKSSDGALFC